MPAAHQRNAICPSRQRFTFELWSRQISIIDSMAFVDRSVRARVGGTPNRVTVSVSDSHGLVAAGKVTRVLVDRERFLERVS